MDPKWLVPSTFFAEDPEFIDSPFSGFGWRLFKRESENFRVLTIEGNSELTNNPSQKIFPIQLNSIASDFTNGFVNAVFNWRWFKRHNG